MNYWVGTSGFQYSEWKGTFYPEDVSTAKMLPFYAERPTTTEINYTFHRIPRAKTIEGWWKADTGAFPVQPESAAKNHPLGEAAKLRQHPALLSSGDLRSQEEAWLRALPIAAAVEKGRRVIGAFLQDVPDGMRGAFEFGTDSWFDDEISASCEIEEPRALHCRQRKDCHARCGHRGLRLPAPPPRRLSGSGRRAVVGDDQSARRAMV